MRDFAGAVLMCRNIEKKKIQRRIYMQIIESNH